jgi:hypothetical protein
LNADFFSDKPSKNTFGTRVEIRSINIVITLFYRQCCQIVVLYILKVLLNE